MKERGRFESAVQEKRQQANRLDNKKKEKNPKTLRKCWTTWACKNDWHQAKKLYQAAKSMEKRLAALEDIQAPEDLHYTRFG